MKKITRTTPTTLNAPVGNYAHITKIPAGLDWYTFSGQVGVKEDGTFDADFNAQVKQTFANIKDILDHESIDVDNVTKVNIWAVETIDWDFFYACWESFFKGDYPSMTIAYVSALGIPEIKLEIEIWAVN